MLDFLEPVNSNVTLQFYPEKDPSSWNSTIELDSSQLQTVAQIAEVAKQHKISADDQLALMNKTRVLSSDKDKDMRQQLYSIRLLAVAAYGT